VCAGEAEDAGPPYALLEHTPLAVLTNGLLAALNELRHCAPLSLAAPVAQTLQGCQGATCGSAGWPNVIGCLSMALAWHKTRCRVQWKVLKYGVLDQAGSWQEHRIARLCSSLAECRF
jgi:hypothetical protein